MSTNILLKAKSGLVTIEPNRGRVKIVAKAFLNILLYTEKHQSFLKLRGKKETLANQLSQLIALISVVIRGGASIVYPRQAIFLILNS